MAQLNADLREFIMPRYTAPDPDAKEPEKPPRPRDPWNPLELLPWYASFGDAPAMTLEHAESLAAAFDDLPEWAKAVAPIDAAQRLLEAPQA